jgi:ribA/ribD-fused uncharacterized protein
MTSALPSKKDFHFFYGHDQKKNGDNACFSNWFPAAFVDAEWPRVCVRVFVSISQLSQPHTAHNSNSEQYMMWRKAELFGDAEMAAAILQERNPGKVKALGRRVRNFDKDKWDAVARQCVRDGVVLKFRQNAALRDVLLATGEKMMVEASPTDAIWGIGLSEERALSTPPASMARHQLARLGAQRGAHHFACRVKPNSLLQLTTKNDEASL